MSLFVRYICVIRYKKIKEMRRVVRVKRPMTRVNLQSLRTMRSSFPRFDVFCDFFSGKFLLYIRYTVLLDFRFDSTFSYFFAFLPSKREVVLFCGLRNYSNHCCNFIIYTLSG